MNIDPSVIDGFDNMTDSEKVTALLGLEMPEKIDMANYIEKEKFDRVASELAAAKKANKSKMTADEALVAERDELKNQISELLKDKTIAENASKYVALGYTQELAQATAAALVNGDIETVFANQKTFNAELEQKMLENVERGLHPNGSKDKTGENPEVALAKKLGKASSDARSASAKALEFYTK